MKNYTTTAVFWRKGLEVPVGTDVSMSDAESKYLKHALAEKKADKDDEPALPLESAPAVKKPGRGEKAEANGKQF